MHRIDDNLRTQLADATVSATRLLRPLDSISDDDARTIIKRYTAAIEGNFLTWMGGASIASRSVVSRFAADENLWVEIRDDHPGMLRRFARCAHSEPNAEDFQYVHDEVMQIRNLASELSGVKTIALMAALESISAVFIPYLADLAQRLGCRDLTYTDVHGEADIGHANQFLEALSDEQNLGYQNPAKDIEDTITLTLNLLKQIFSYKRESLHLPKLGDQRRDSLMKRPVSFFSMTLILCLSTSFLSSCTRVPEDPAQTAIRPANSSTLSSIRNRGDMRVGYLVWNPTVIQDPQSGSLSGIYPDMVAEIAKALNVAITWHETTPANFAAGLQSNQFDFSVGATFVTIPRALAVSFTQPVAYVGNAGVVRTDGTFHPSVISDLNRPGIRIAVLQGQAMEEYCRANVTKAVLVVISGGDLTAPLVAVSSGRADIGLMNSVTVAQYTADHPEVKPVLIGDQEIELLPLAWATRPNDDELLDFLNTSITYLKSTGRLTKYQKKYSIQLLYDTPELHEGH